MKTASTLGSLFAAALFVVFVLHFGAPQARAFEGRLAATLVRGGETQTWHYTIKTDQARIERGETDRPYAWNLVALDSGAMTLVFPHNRSFVRLKPSSQNPVQPPGFPAAPAGLPPGIGPQAQPPGMPAAPAGGLPPAIGPGNFSEIPVPPGGLPPGVGPQAPAPHAPGVPSLPAMPMMPMPTDTLELTATGEKTDLLGYPCEKFELKAQGEEMEIWATDRLFAFHPWVQNQSPRHGPRTIEEQWGELLRARQLFPLRAVLRMGHDNGMERLRFEVRAITPEKLKDTDTPRFLPPADYHQLDPLPF